MNEGRLIISAKRHLLEREAVVLCEIDVGMSLGELADRLCMSPEARGSLVVEIDGCVVAPALWNKCWPKANTRVRIFPAYRGGEQGKQAAMLVAMLAITIATAGAGSFIGLGAMSAGAMGFSTTGIMASVMTAGLTVVGALALSALFRPPDQSEAAAARQYYSIASQSNSARPDGGLMKIYGTMRVFPDVIALPYRRNVNGLESLDVIYGYGDENVITSKTTIGNTPFHDFKSTHLVNNRHFSKGDSLSFYLHKAWSESLSYTLKNDHDQSNILNNTPPNVGSDEWVNVTSEEKTDRIELDFMFAQGLHFTDDSSNGVAPNNIEIWISARDEGAATWVEFNTFFSSVRYLKHSDIGISLGSNVVDGGRPIHIKEEEVFPFIVTVVMTLPSGHSNKKVELKIGRSGYTGGVTGGPEESARDRSNCKLVSMRSFRHIPPIAPEKDITIQEVRVEATDQLSGTIDNLSSLCKSQIPSRAAGAWKTGVGETNNPAWIYIDILKGQLNKKPVANDRIDLAQFDKWAIYCDTLVSGKKFITCNFTHTNIETVDQLLQKVAACGNASRTIRDGKQSIIFDAEAPYPVQIFTQRNSWGFGMVKTFVDQPDGIRVKYIDAADDYKEAEIIAYSPGFSATNADTVEDLESFGCTDRDQAHRSGLRYLAMGRYRNEVYSFNADVENIACERGDRIRVSYSCVREGGITGRIMRIAGDTITLDQKHNQGIAPLAVGSKGMTIRSISGGSATINHLVIASFGGDYNVTPSTTLPSSVKAGDLVVVGDNTEISEDYLISSIVPGDDLTAKITATNYAREMQDYSNGGFDKDRGVDCTGVAMTKSKAVVDAGEDFTLTSVIPAGKTVRQVRWVVTNASAVDKTGLSANFVFRITEGGTFPVYMAVDYVNGDVCNISSTMTVNPLSTSADAANLIIMPLVRYVGASLYARAYMKDSWINVSRVDFLSPGATPSSGSEGEGEKFYFKYATVGRKTITANIRIADGKTVTKTLAIDILSDALEIHTSIPPDIFNVNQVISLSATSAIGTITNYQWTATGGAVITTATSAAPTIMWTTSGDYTITLTATAGGVSRTVTVPVKVSPKWTI